MIHPSARAALAVGVATLLAVGAATLLAVGAATVLAAAIAFDEGEDARSPLAGVLEDSAGRPVPGGFVVARAPGSAAATAVVSDASGRYRLPALPDGSYALEARAVGFGTARREDVRLPGGTLDFVLRVSEDPAAGLPTSSFLRVLPDGPEKRAFLLDCTGCHGLDAAMALPEGAPRSRESWEESVARMLSFAGPATSFPVIGPRDPAATASWLAAHLGTPGGPRPAYAPLAVPLDDAPRAVISEYDLPEPADLPHDLMVGPDGRVVITGMMTHRMYVLDPATAEFSTVPIPVPEANPRALDIDRGGTWWVLLGGPRMVASLAPGGEWRTWPIGVYPHSARLDGAGGLWFNGHFTRDPVEIGRLDVRSGEVRRYAVPPPAMEPGAQPIPYGLRVGPDGAVWTTELLGNRLVRLDPVTGGSRAWTLPSPRSGPRRPDVDAAGIVWIPEYAGNRLARFDPDGETFLEYELPVPDALPYVARVDPRTGRVWIGTAGADALFRFDPATERFASFPLPSRGALLRHIDVDARTGDVWGAYGPWPPRAPRIVRLRAP